MIIKCNTFQGNLWIFMWVLHHIQEQMHFLSMHVIYCISFDIFKITSDFQQFNFRVDVVVFILHGGHLALCICKFISSNLGKFFFLQKFSCPIPFLFSIWYSTYMYVGLLDIMQQPLFIFLKIIFSVLFILEDFYSSTFKFTLIPFVIWLLILSSGIFYF